MNVISFPSWTDDTDDGTVSLLILANAEETVTLSAEENHDHAEY